MKYLALLRDSFRQALDSKVLYITLGLTGVLLFFLFSMSYRQVSVREHLDYFVGLLNWAHNLEASSQGRQADVIKVLEFHETKKTKDAPPWERTYEFAVAIEQPNKNDTVPSKHIENLERILYGGFWFLHGRIGRKPVRDKDWKNRKYVFTFTSTGARVKRDADWLHEASLFFGLLRLPWFRSSMSYSVYWIENILVSNVGGWFIVLIGLIVSSFLIPNMLQKGSVDLQLVKPMSRPVLLIFKYLGGLAFVFLNSLVAIGGAWLALGVKTGIWAPAFLVSLFVIALFFAVLYSVSTLIAVLARNAVAGIIGGIFVSLVAWLALYGLGITYSYLHVDENGGANVQMRNVREQPVVRVVAQVVDVAHFLLPQTDQMSAMTTYYLSRSILSDFERDMWSFPTGRPNVWQTLTSCFAFIAVMLGLACWRFARQDF